MDFRSVNGQHHLLEPIGYGQIRKTKKRGAPVRSATEQFLIHEVAYEFKSSTLLIPKPFRIEGNSYTMEQFWTGSVLPMNCMYVFPLLIAELRRFKEFLYTKNLYPVGFKILQINHESIETWERIPFSGPIYGLVDFSRFGIIQGPYVKIPKVDVVLLNKLDPIFELYFLSFLPLQNSIENTEDTEVVEEYITDTTSLPFCRKN